MGGGRWESKACFGLPTDDNALEFRFRRGDPVYRRLVSTPGLRANIVVDRVSRQILGVTFRGGMSVETVKRDFSVLAGLAGPNFRPSLPLPIDPT